MVQSKQSHSRKRRLRVGDTAWVRLTPTVPGVERIVRRLNREPNVSDFIRRLILAEIEREERGDSLKSSSPDVLAELVTLVRGLAERHGPGAMRAIQADEAPAAPGAPPPPAPPAPAAGRTARGRDQLQRLLSDD